MINKSPKHSKRSLAFKTNMPLLLMATPGIIYFICFSYMPMVGLILAFKNFIPRLGIFGSSFVGLKNFRFMFLNATFWASLRNTVYYNFAFMILSILFPVILAVSLSEVRNVKISRLLQTIMIMPHFVSYVIISVVVFAILSAGNGIISHIMTNLGHEPIYFYSEPKYWPFILTLSYLWRSVGYSSILYIGTIVGISSEYYEAAIIDGATKWQQITYITLPFLKPMVIILLIMKIGAMFSTNFDLFYQVPLNSGQLYPVTNTIDVFVYNTLKDSNNVSLASAAAFVQSIAGFVLVLITNQIVRKLDPDSSMF